MNAQGQKGVRIMDTRRAVQIVISLAIASLLLVGCSSRLVAPAGTSATDTAVITPPLDLKTEPASPGSKPFLTFVEVQKNGVGAMEGLKEVWDVTMSPDGRHVYAAGYRDNTVVVLSRDSATGKLTPVEVQRRGVGGVDGILGAIAVAVSPDGKHVYVAGHWSHAVVAFNRDSATGKLTFVEAQKEAVGGVHGLIRARSLIVSPDGRHVYVAALRNHVVVFSRNNGTGKLAFVEIQKQGVGGVDGLAGATSVTQSPDGRHIYVAAYYHNAVAVFSRNTITGRLTFVEALKDGAGDLDGLRMAASAKISPDGKYAYVAGFGDSSLVVFRRDITTGKLTLVEALRHGIDGIDGLNGIFAVAMSPDGKLVFNTDFLDGAVGVFRRDATTGKLAFIEVKKDGVGDAKGLGGARSVTVSPDGKHIYVAGFWSDSLAVFRTP